MGVISEGLRLSYGSTLRLPRVAPDETLHYDGFEIPPGVSWKPQNTEEITSTDQVTDSYEPVKLFRSS